MEAIFSHYNKCELRSCVYENTGKIFIVKSPVPTHPETLPLCVI